MIVLSTRLRSRTFFSTATQLIFVYRSSQCVTEICYTENWTFLRCKNDSHCKESISLKWTMISNSFHRQLIFFIIQSRSGLCQHMEIYKKIWSVRLGQSVIFKIFNSCWLSNKPFGKEASNDSQQHLNVFFFFSFLFYVPSFKYNESCSWSRMASLTLFTVMFNVTQLLE